MPEIESSGEPLDLFQVLEDAGSVKGHLSSVSSLTEPFARSPSTEPTASTGNVHPLSAIFAELWAARDEESRVEVHLENGGVFLPDGYLKTHSQQGYAVLVTQDPDGCSTLTIVPWDGISRIIMRSMKQIPGEIVR